MRSVYEIRTAEDGHFYWVLKAANGEIVATSEFYTRREDAERGVKAAQEAAAQSETTNQRGI